MAKGGFRPNMGGVNANMIKQAQKMQQDMLRMQEELENKEYEASVGGGVVTARVNGKHEVLALNIKPEAVDPEDVEMLQDMVMAAVISYAQGRRRGFSEYVSPDWRTESQRSVLICVYFLPLWSGSASNLHACPASEAKRRNDWPFTSFLPAQRRHRSLPMPFCRRNNRCICAPCVRI